jgi:predicted ATPase/DNA-binding SARP family transcriptional activator
MEVLLLGPLEVRDQGRSLNVRGSRPRALLALLALNAGRVMPADRLIELLWGDEPPPSAANALQVHISALRKVLEPQGPPYRLLISDRSGYALKVDTEQVDFARFERLVERAHHALKQGELEQCAKLVGQAIDQWRGSALADMSDQPWSIGEARRLEELRLAAEEDRIEAALALGGHSELIPELESLVTMHPLRERLSAQLMLALYRSGRQAEASDVYQRTRETLVEGLGMEPGHELQQLLKAIINQDRSLGMPTQESQPPRLDNLPATLTSFVDRTQERAQLTLLLAETRMLTLTGPGGIGKTRLAIEVARGLVDDYERGIWLANFGSLADPDLVPQAVGSVLLVRNSGGVAPTEALISYLSNRHCLLLFDNCEHLIDACATLAEALVTSCPRVTVLATSREALGVAGEVVWPVPALDLPELTEDRSVSPAREWGAVELFRQRAESAIGSFRLDDGGLQMATKVCRQLDGIPLAIELAAARLKVISLDELSARLGDRFQILIGGSRTALPRHQTLRAAIDWSYDLLSEDERSALRMLSVFAGTFTLEAAEAICGEMPRGGVEVLDVVSSLVRKSLMQVDRSDLEVRYQILDTIREYAYQKLSETDHLGTARHRHAGFYLDLAERAAPHLRGPSATVWMARLARDHNNIRAAVRWWLEVRESDRFARLLVAMWWFWYVRCLFDEGRRWLEIAITDLKPSSLPTQVALLLGAGQLAWAQGDHETDRTMFEKALSTAKDGGDESLVGHALLRMSLADYAAGRMNVAEEHLEDSIRLLRKYRQESLLGEALNNLGWIRAFYLNDRSTAGLLLDESLLIARQCGDQWTLQEVLDSIGNLKTALGEVDAAEGFQEESLRICSDLGDAWSLPRTLTGFVRMAVARRQAERALRLSGAAAKARDDVGMVLMTAEQAELDLLIEVARAQLPSDLADAAWWEGSQMTMNDAVGYALSHEPVVLGSH